MRKQTRVVQVGTVKIGGEEPVRVQSMTNTDTRDITATVNRFKGCRLQAANCTPCGCGSRGRRALKN